MPERNFFKKHIIAIVMIPSIIGIHYGWSLLQHNEALVKGDEKIEFPPFSISKLVWHKISNFNQREEDIPRSPKID